MSESSEHALSSVGSEETDQIPETPRFDEATLARIRDYWTVYERHYDEVRLVVLAELAGDEEVGRIIRATPPDALEQQGKLSREITRRAIFEGDWEGYLAHLRAQGTTYAGMGFSFGAWFRAVSAFRPHMVRHLLATYGGDTQRLIGAIDGMDQMVDLALSSIGESYLAAQEEVISRQREAIGELRVRARYQVVLASIADGVVTTDPYGNVVTINPAMERLGGVSADDAIGRPYHEVYPILRDGAPVEFHDRYLTKAVEQRTTLMSEGIDIRLRCADGREIPVTITAAPIIEEGGKLLGGVAVIRASSEKRASA